MHAGPGAAAADADRAGGIAEFGRVGLAGPQNAANLVDSVLVALEDCLDGIQDVVALVLAEHLDQAAAADEALRWIERECEVFHQQGSRADFGCFGITSEVLGATALVGKAERTECARAPTDAGAEDRAGVVDHVGA